jgi:SAM-dependent methyltransferase
MAGSDQPTPPRRLRARVGAPGAREFAEGGRAAAAELEAALLASGSPGFDAYASILDFGCGSARVLPHVHALAPGARCAGCDVDEAAVAWATRAHPGLDLRVSAASPPLPFAAGSFQLVYSISVLSHLDEAGQDAWLAELARVLLPGGVALLSVHGPDAFAQFRSGAVRSAWCDPAAFERPELGADEFVFMPYRRSIWNRSELRGVDTAYGLAFHGPDYVRRRWPTWFEVVNVVPAGVTDWQDVIVCRARSLQAMDVDAAGEEQ